MTQKTGALIFDETADRYDIRFDLNDYYGGLHCGDFRKWGGIPTAITQNVKDLLASREVENIFENSDFVLMLNQAQGDRTILAKQLNISPQQMKYVTHTEAGEGLIFYGNVVLPFVDRFPKDTELYRVMTTKPEEVSESGK